MECEIRLTWVSKINQDRITLGLMVSINVKSQNRMYAKFVVPSYRRALFCEGPVLLNKGAKTDGL